MSAAGADVVEPPGATDRPDRSDRWKDVAALGIVAVALLLPVIGLMHYQGPPMEEGFMLAFPEQILQGRMPHDDFLHLYGPGSLWVLAGVYKLFGTSLTVERLVGLLQHAAVAYGLFAALRPWGRRVSTSAAVISVVVLIGPLGLSAMAWNGALAFGICSLAVGTSAARRQDDRRARRLLFIAGLLGGLALLYRPDLVLAVALGLGALWWDLERPRRAPLVWGAVAGVALYIPHLIVSGPVESFRGMFLEPVFELRGGRSLPIPPSWGEVDGFLQRAGALRQTGWPLPMPAVSQQIFLWFALVPLSIALVVFAAWKLRRREPRSSRSLCFWPLALFAAALLQQALQRPDTAHLSWVTGITFALCVPAIASLLEGRLPSWSPGGRTWVGIGAVAVVLIAVIPFYPLRTYADLVGQTFGRNRFGYPITNEGRTFYFGDSAGAESAQRVVDRLQEEAEPGDTLIVGPKDLSRTNYSDAFFYYLFPDLEPGTRYIEMDPGLADAEGSGLSDELLDNDWLILSDAWSGWEEPNDSSGHGSEAPNRVVEDHYCTVEDAGTFELLRRCR
ncbi:glycosyltransferase family 39 protein [Dermatobacter hominis]|uniref:glycosyltransferase family 39 protein n=1 Tax=Dermatobacter hominis TaxID=2884263 RepID=UPI001D1260E7|nr:glycosyltransferase family 39 protein [Dermatobacter hominis]UDY36463.1 glycosyltransferase family 39 protein [Dermatobacter hominis]